jgi:hypothetical protein
VLVVVREIGKTRLELRPLVVRAAVEMEVYKHNTDLMVQQTLVLVGEVAGMTLPRLVLLIEKVVAAQE